MNCKQHSKSKSVLGIIDCAQSYTESVSSKHVRGRNGLISGRHSLVIVISAVFRRSTEIHRVKNDNLRSDLWKTHNDELQRTIDNN